MEEHKLDYDSDIIICEEIPETISVSTSPELKKPKAKKRKRKVKKSINFNNNMETLLITQKLKVKKTQFKCVININTVCEERSESIVRYNSNVCKKEAYYHRIVPSCLREMCSGDAANCCRSTISSDYNKHYPGAGSLSPVSSISLSEVAEVISCNISYEDVSNGSFSSGSEEVDTLIKRTRQREKQVDNSHSTRKYTTSTPMFKADDTASPFSIDIDKKSIHSDNTLVINPLPTEAYSPTSLKLFKIDNLENDDDTNDMLDINIPYSPTMTPDLINKNIDYSPVGRTHDDTPYSPSYTPETIEVEMDYDLNRNPASLDDLPYSPTFTPDMIEMGDSGDAQYCVENNEPYSPTMTPNSMKMETSDRANLNEIVDVGYSPRSTVTTDFHKFTITQTDDSNQNALYSRGKIIQNNTIIGNTAPKFAILTPDLIKKEIENTHEEHFDETDYNMNNTINCKTEKDDRQRGMHNQADPSTIIVKMEKDDLTNVNHVNHVYSSVFKNNVSIKTEYGNRGKTENY